MANSSMDTRRNRLFFKEIGGGTRLSLYYVGTYSYSMIS